MDLLAVTVPVADLRREPVEASGTYAHDDLQETQLLFNELLLLVGEEQDWYLVEAVEQPRYGGARAWQGYPGWVSKGHTGPVTGRGQLTALVHTKTADLLDRPSPRGRKLITLPLATKVEALGEEGSFLKARFLTGVTGWIAKGSIRTFDKGVGDLEGLENSARMFLGTPYLWGGRSIFLPHLARTATGVDCSGFTQLVYRLNGSDIPRNAHDQWRAAYPVPPERLEGGDLIFLSGEDGFENITHVMLSLGGERFIEAAEGGLPVREVTFEARLGLPLAGLREQDFVAGARKVYFGRPKGQREFREMSNE